MSCTICFDAFDNELVPVACCGDSHPPCCSGCFETYIRIILKDAYMGSCPLITCPITKEKNAIPLKYSLWTSHVDTEMKDRYDELAGSAIAFRCIGCDTVTPLTDECRYTSCIDNMNECLTSHHLEANTFHDLIQDIDLYENNHQSVDEFYRLLSTKYFPKAFESIVLSENGHQKDIWKMMKCIVKLVNSPDKKTTLLHRHIRLLPRIWTACW